MKHTMLHMKLNSAVSALAVTAAFSVLLPPSNAYCGICFLPDCGNEILAGGGDINMNLNEDTEWCEKKGYTYYASGKCPQFYAQVAKCSRDNYYLKCDAVKWCTDNGYNTQSCSIPNYIDEQCPNGKPYYKRCKADYPRACRDTGYTNSCPLGQKLHASGRCSYDSSYGTCCAPSGCPAYTSLSYSSYGANGSDGCGYTCYYTCNPNCPSGTSTSNPGGCGGSTRNGCNTKTCYYPYQSCCTPSCSDTSSYCSCGSYYISDGCGGTCKRCESCCSPYSDETGCSCGSYSCSDGCGGTRRCCSSCPDPTSPSSGSESGGGNNGGSSGSGSGSGSSTPSTPSCTDTCSGKGYYSSKPAGMTCSTTTVCGSTCYYNCKSSDPCANVTCGTDKYCSGGTCKCYNISCSNGSHCVATNSCGGCSRCGCTPVSCSSMPGCTPYRGGECRGTITHCLPITSDCEQMAAFYFCC